MRPNPTHAARRAGHLAALCALLALACGDSSSARDAGSSPDAARATGAADAASESHQHDAAAHESHDGLDAGTDAGPAPKDAGSPADAAQDSGVPVDAAPAEPDASAACVSYCTCMAANCADKVFARGCLTECAAQSRWDLPCRQNHCGLVPAQPDNDHCTHAHGMVQCLDL